MGQGICLYCGAYSRRQCAWYDDTDTEPDMGGAPCEEMADEEVFGPEDEDVD